MFKVSARNLIPVAAVALLALSPRSARGEGWWVGTRAPAAFEEEAVKGEVSLRAGWAPGLVPPFRSGARDRIFGGVDAEGWLAGRVRLGLSWEWLMDDTEASAAVSGPGDVRLGTAVRLVGGGDWTAGLGWEAKLPNAANETELGTDETDILFGGWGRWGHGPWSASAALGLGVLGNPLRFANQDDVPMIRAEGGWGAHRFGARVLLVADVATPRNPARVSLGGALRYGEPWFIEVEGAGGLTPAAADGQVMLRIGVTGALPRRGPGE